MKRQKLLLQRLTRKPGDPPSFWGGLQARMIVSYLGATLLAALVFQIAHTVLFLFIQRSSQMWSQLMIPDTLGLLIASLIGGLIGIVFTRRIIERLRRIAAATTRFATGQYNQQLEVATADEIGQLEARFNQMAAQLAEHLAREKILVEQNARLQERARLSRDLHDSVKQQVFALAVQVELARSLLEQDRAAAQTHLGFADELSYQIQQELTALIHALRPADLQAKGLMTALRDAVTTWSQQTGIAADIHLPETCPLPSAVEEALWRLIQEALSNVARHSQASRIHLHLERLEQQVTLFLSDNGQGFDPSAIERRESFGLRSIRERIEQVRGTIQIRSTRGTGTRIIVHCPLSQEQATQAASEVTA